MPAKLSPQAQAFLREKVHASVATLMKDGSPQVTITWVDTDGDRVLINTSEHRVKTRNLRRDPRVAVSVMDPNDAHRWLRIRGVAKEITQVGAEDHIDLMAKKYRGVDRYDNHDPSNPRVLVKIEPLSIAEAKLAR